MQYSVWTIQSGLYSNMKSTDLYQKKKRIKKKIKTSDRAWLAINVRLGFTQPDLTVKVNCWLIYSKHVSDVSSQSFKQDKRGEGEAFYAWGQIKAASENLNQTQNLLTLFSKLKAKKSRVNLTWTVKSSQTSSLKTLNACWGLMSVHSLCFNSL